MIQVITSVFSDEEKYYIEEMIKDCVHYLGKHRFLIVDNSGVGRFKDFVNKFDNVEVYFTPGLRKVGKLEGDGNDGFHSSSPVIGDGLRYLMQRGDEPEYTICVDADVAFCGNKLESFLKSKDFDILGVTDEAAKIWWSYIEKFNSHEYFHQHTNNEYRGRKQEVIWNTIGRGIQNNSIPVMCFGIWVLSKTGWNILKDAELKYGIFTEKHFITKGKSWSAEGHLSLVA